MDSSASPDPAVGFKRNLAQISPNVPHARSGPRDRPLVRGLGQQQPPAKRSRIAEATDAFT